MTPDADWLFDRAIARVEPVVEALLADYATSYVGRPVQRRETRPPSAVAGIVWSIDGEPLVEFVHQASAPDHLFVRDIALLDTLRRRLRSRHVQVQYVASPGEP